MTSEIVLANARIVTADEVIRGTLHVKDGRIIGLARGATALPGAVDCDGDYVVPGLVELHTDNLEKHVTPRPKVRWHPGSAALAHDAQMASAGITTVFDAISCGDIIEGSTRLETLEDMVGAVSDAQARGHFRAEHRLHLRCEVSSANILELFGAFADNPLVGIVSLMDHTPGQRQFVREDKYYEYYQGKYGFSDAEMVEFTRRQQENSARYSDPHRRAIAATCRERGLTLASHDDATPEHVAEAAGLGIHFAEFPTTVEAARASRAAGMMVLMGAPNLVRGGSHSGNVSAAELAGIGCLDVLSSDYVPISLMEAAFLLHGGPLGFALPAAIATVAANPARVAGLDDRGTIAVGKRADLVRVHDAGHMPVVRAVWRQGRRIA
ncbi:alpha-D-ribose 1-methylphosphonate 5-triphosphate diphosphatase [Magnetospirillum sp. UT-4]|uniref:alpha-D-ribose 1-methylphosphonate 5-triphosphate diphosphatase n=1 Tax=Magnetospirillum sp. UT-4 TaxID=2681467 RepID=UPI00137CD4F4|nr:alpha-D-ribose 1-methylphosphonate 5-triphosphate diphosphatase [Magnetospirillum sp. UT-4]CAA7616873.1 carbon-phosphorus lyase complex subunit [Magnetospirillum sp. UT-4]